MNSYERRFRNIAQVIVDLISLKVLWEVMIHARVWLNPLLTAQISLEASTRLAPPMVLVLVLWMATSFRFGLYRIRETSGFWEPELSAFENAFTLTMLTAVVTFGSREFGDEVSRSFVLLILPIAFIIFSVSRHLSSGLVTLARTQLPHSHRIALVGDWGRSGPLSEQLQRNPLSSFRGVIVPERDLAFARASAVPVLGTIDKTAELINTERLDRVIFVNGSLPNAEIEHCTRVLTRMGMPISCALDSATEQFHMGVDTSCGLPFVELVPIQFTRQQAIAKRVFDLLLSAILLIILSPLLILIGILIKTTSKGPILYKALRTGKGGRHFTFLKFRSMYVNSGRTLTANSNEKHGHIFKMKRDPRITKIGRILRRYSLDELPQLVNILLGEMSFVGPRPLPACDLGPDGMSQTFVAWSERRASVLPGLTGLWQISGRSDLAFEDMVRLDLYYIQNWSFALDIKIMLNTPMLVLKGVGAY